MASLLDAITQRLAAEERDYALQTGQGRHPKEKYDERVGYSKGLRRAMELVMEEAKKVNNEEND